MEYELVIDAIIKYITANPLTSVTLIGLIFILFIFKSEFSFLNKQNGELSKQNYKLKTDNNCLTTAIMELHKKCETCEYKKPIKRNTGNLCIEHNECKYFKYFEKAQNNKEQNAIKAEERKQKNVNIGTDFEKKVYNILEQYGYRNLFINIICDTQVDIVSVNTNGIYIFECKCWDGTILGDINWTKWLQLKEFDCYNDNDSNDTILASQFTNPIKQIENQEKALRKLLKRYEITDNIYFKRIVVFEDCAKLSKNCNDDIGENCVGIAKNLYSKVIYLKDLNTNGYYSENWGTQVSYSRQRINSICSAFKDYEKGYGYNYKNTNTYDLECN